jgi:drug/metabolite transporter (DMT)-like permease
VSQLGRRQEAIRGFIYIAGATLLWAVSATLGRAAFTGRPLFGQPPLEKIDPLIISQARTTFSFLLLLPVLLVRGGRGPLRMLPADLGKVLLLGLLGLVPSNYFYYLAIQRTGVATAITIQYTAPAWVLLYMVARGRQRATLPRMGAVGLAVVGIGLVIGLFRRGGFHLDPGGVAAALLAAFAFSFYTVGGHDILARYSRWTVLLYTLLGASLFWVMINSPWKVAAAHYSSRQAMFLLVFALVSALLPYSLFFAGLQHIEPTKVIVASCLEPVFSILIAAVALGEGMRPLQGLGVALVLVAVVVVQLPDEKSREEQIVVEPIE